MSAPVENLDTVDDFLDESVVISTFPKYAGTGNVTDRVSIITKRGQICRAFVHFYREKGFVCLTKKGEEKAICCDKLGAPDQKFGVVIFQYHTDQTGALADPTKCKGAVKLWMFSEKKWEDLKAVAREFPLLDSGPGAEQVDIQIACEDTKWQKMKMTPTKAAHWKSNPEWYKTVSDLADQGHQKLLKAIGRVQDLDGVKEILGVQVPLPQDAGGAGEVDLDDILKPAES